MRLRQQQYCDRHDRYQADHGRYAASEHTARMILEPPGHGRDTKPGWRRHRAARSGSLPGRLARAAVSADRRDSADHG